MWVMIMQIKRNITISFINTYQKCPAQFRYVYIDKAPFVPNGPLVLGRAFHEAVALNYSQKETSYMDLPLSDLRDVFVESFDRGSKDAIFYDKNADELKDCGLKALSLYQEKIAVNTYPSKVETPFLIDYGKKKFAGRIDVIDESGVIIEIKTTQKTPSVIKEDYKLQLISYSIATKLKKVRVDYAICKKVPEVFSTHLKITRKDIKRFKLITQSTIKAIESNLFYPNRNSFLCSKKYCSYYEQCTNEYGG